MRKGTHFSSYLQENVLFCARLIVPLHPKSKDFDAKEHIYSSSDVPTAADFLFPETTAADDSMGWRRY